MPGVLTRAFVGRALAVAELTSGCAEPTWVAASRPGEHAVAPNTSLSATAGQSTVSGTNEHKPNGANVSAVLTAELIVKADGTLSCVEPEGCPLGLGMPLALTGIGQAIVSTERGLALTSKPERMIPLPPTLTPIAAGQASEWGTGCILTRRSSGEGLDVLCPTYHPREMQTYPVEQCIDAPFTLGPAQSSSKEYTWCLLQHEIKGTVSAVAGSYAFGCVVSANSGEVACWHTESRLTPISPGVRVVPGAVDVAVGSDHACVRTSEGRVACWGEGTDGQLGGTEGTIEFERISEGFEPNAHIARTTPPKRLLAFSSKALQVVTNRLSTCVRIEEGDVWCWGRMGDLLRTDGGSESYHERELRVREAFSQRPKPVDTLHSAPVRLPDGCRPGHIALTDEELCVTCVQGCVICWSEEPTQPCRTSGGE